MGRHNSECLLTGSGTRIHFSVNTNLWSRRGSLRRAGAASAGRLGTVSALHCMELVAEPGADAGENHLTATYTHTGTHMCIWTHVHTCICMHAKWKR